jgi:hypothetical protein
MRRTVREATRGTTVRVLALLLTVAGLAVALNSLGPTAAVLALAAALLASACPIVLPGTTARRRGGARSHAATWRLRPR